jgi:arylsulfatase A-like enzyme
MMEWQRDTLRPRLEKPRSLQFSGRACRIWRCSEIDFVVRQEYNRYMRNAAFPVRARPILFKKIAFLMASFLCILSCSSRTRNESWVDHDLLPDATAQLAESFSATIAVKTESRLLNQSSGSVVKIYEELPARFRIKMRVRASRKTRASLRIVDEHGKKIFSGALKKGETLRTISRRAGGILELAFIAEGSPGAAVVWEEICVQIPGPLSTPMPDKLSAPVAAPQKSVLPASRPDIFLYVVDALRADHLGCYGYGRDTSPRIDDFARGNSLYLNAYSHTSWTRSSAASILSGLTPREHRTIGRDDRLPEEIITLAERLQEGGYETIALIANGHLHSVYGFAQGFQTFEYLGLVSSARIQQRTEKLLLQRMRQKERKPIFFLIWTIDPHDPYEPEREDAKLFSIGDFERLPLTKENLLIMIRSGQIQLTPSQKKCLEARYDQEIHGNDRSFGKLLDFLQAQGLADEAVVFFTSDHGEEFFDHGGVGHGDTLYNEQVCVPLIIRAPFIAKGRHSARVQHFDLYPTILEIAGCPRPEGLAGISLTEKRSGPRKLFFELGLDNYDLTAVLDDRKVIYSKTKNGAPALTPVFQVFGNKDLAEIHPRLPEAFKDKLLQQDIFHYRHVLDSAPRRAGFGKRNIPPELKKQLEALGYIN